MILKVCKYKCNAYKKLRFFFYFLIMLTESIHGSNFCKFSVKQMNCILKYFNSAEIYVSI